MELSFYDSGVKDVARCPIGCKGCKNSTYCNACFNSYYLVYKSHEELTCTACTCKTCFFGNSRIKINYDFYKKNDFKNKTAYNDFLAKNKIKEFCTSCANGKFLNSSLQCQTCSEKISSCEECYIGSFTNKLETYDNYKALNLVSNSSADIESYFSSNKYKLRCSKCKSAKLILRRNYNLESCITCGENCEMCNWIDSKQRDISKNLPLSLNSDYLLKCMTCKSEYNFHYDGKTCFNCASNTGDSNCNSCAYYTNKGLALSSSNFYSFTNPIGFEIKCLGCKLLYGLNKKNK